MPIIYQIYTENQVFTGIVKPSQRQLQKTSFFTPFIYGIMDYYSISSSSWYSERIQYIM